METGHLGPAGVHALLPVVMAVFNQELEPVCRLVEAASHKTVQPLEKWKHNTWRVDRLNVTTHLVTQIHSLVSLHLVMCVSMHGHVSPYKKA